MQEQREQHAKLSAQMVQLIDFYRGIILDSIEAETDEEQWHRIRPRILKALGDRGLDGRIRDLLDKHFKMKGVT